MKEKDIFIRIETIHYYDYLLFTISVIMYAKLYATFEFSSIHFMFFFSFVFLLFSPQFFVFSLFHLYLSVTPSWMDFDTLFFHDYQAHSFRLCSIHTHTLTHFETRMKRKCSGNVRKKKSIKRSALNALLFSFAFKCIESICGILYFIKNEKFKNEKNHLHNIAYQMLNACICSMFVCM